MTRKKPISATALSKRKMESQGYLVGIVEKWNPHCKIRQDLFGFVDLVALKGEHTLYIQTTTASNAAARVTKIRAHKNFPRVNEGSPWRQVVVHSWSKRGARGKRKTWTCREIEVVEEKGQV